MTLAEFLASLDRDDDTRLFSDTLAVIDRFYGFTPTYFKNGDQENQPNQNNGSCKCFAFALLHNLGEAQTLRLFAEHYRQVLEHPQGTDHRNIRQFMQNGFSALRFAANPLVAIASCSKD